MAKALSRETWLRAIAAERERLHASLRGLTDAQLRSDGVKPGWSINDIIMHLVAWERRMQRRIAAIRGGRAARTEPDTRLFNEKVYRRYHGWPTAKVRRAARDSYRRVEELVERLTLKDLRDARIASLLRLNTTNHYQWAGRKIRSWRRREGV